MKKFALLLIVAVMAVTITSCGSDGPRVCANDSTIILINDTAYVADTNMVAAGQLHQATLNSGDSVPFAIPYLRGDWVSVSAVFYYGYYHLTFAGIADTTFYMGTETCGGVTVPVRLSTLQWK